jgi:hypothetical protein
MAKDSDPKDDPKFQKVVQTFLNTPPQPHKPKAPSKKKGAAPTHGTAPKSKPSKRA